MAQQGSQQQPKAVTSPFQAGPTPKSHPAICQLATCGDTFVTAQPAKYCCTAHRVAANRRLRLYIRPELDKLAHELCRLADLLADSAKDGDADKLRAAAAVLED